ncbi:Na/Pi cotransporter family protein [Neisseria wadsworthii]|uniref:Na+/Pi-cotransporter n=1 Tax=Neisseria wadsworthii 9715 TaxID=1030841 RepID=G4CQT0_9NEIS|nr:Na/Pi symporter [Neisseria wadsworthii]EGZ46182.1 Na+/Pi-cotransporter [Neisseria wadsworthii 9715]QMT35169.1 Na/Pi cotransporter family protein [Neisseria wadsworthii]
MEKNPLKTITIIAVAVALAISFWYSSAWLQLCYGLALFLFGMQSIEEGLHNAAGGMLERLMAKSTATPLKGMLFGMSATFVLQSSTLVSLLTMAFLSAGLITLAGGIAVILGTNLGATSGIWLLALAGQSISLSPAAVPMLVFGILAGFFKGKMKGLGRVLVGISLIFLGIDAIKEGFQSVGHTVDFASIQVQGVAEVAIFVLIGLLLTIILQSTHATLILTLAALAGGQISLAQAFAIAIGSNVGSSASTAFVGMLGSDRGGQRLAMAHLLFNVVTACLSLLLWLPLTSAVNAVGNWLGMSDLLQLAFFHTIFNVLGLTVFWKFQNRLAEELLLRLPETAQAGLQEPKKEKKRHALYLNENMLRSCDTALRAVCKEIEHLNTLSLEVICQALFIPEQALYEDVLSSELILPEKVQKVDVQTLYQDRIKPLYGELVEFTSKTDIDERDDKQKLLMNAHMAAMQMVEIVKGCKHLQKNMQHYLQQPQSPVYKEYLDLRAHLFDTLKYFYRTSLSEADSPERTDNIAILAQHVEMLDTVFRTGILEKLRAGKIDSWQTTSLMNDINYAKRIGLGFLDILREEKELMMHPTDKEQEAA